MLVFGLMKKKARITEYKFLMRVDSVVRNRIHNDGDQSKNQVYSQCDRGGKFSFRKLTKKGVSPNDIALFNLIELCHEIREIVGKRFL